MGEIWTMGEMLVEIMRPKAGMALFAPGEFVGPFPSGAPAIFIDTVARLNHSAGIIGGVGKDDFGKNILDRLKKTTLTRTMFSSQRMSPPPLLLSPILTTVQESLSITSEIPRP